MTVRWASDSNIQSREFTYPVGRVTLDTWTRPASWPSLPTVTSSDNKFVGLYAVFPDIPVVSFTFLTTVGGTLTVDWGDGTTDVVAHNTQITHTYDYSDPDLDSSTVATFGYKTAIITVTPNISNQQITGFNLIVAPQNYSFNSQWSTGWLDIAVASTSLFTAATTIGTTSSSSRHRYLERLQVLNCTTASNSAGNALFANLNNAYVITVPAHFRPTGANEMFEDCWNLLEAPWFDASAITNADSMFNGCTNLVSVPGYDLTACNNTGSMFFNCRNLREVGPIITDSTLISCNSMFRGCLSLHQVPLFDTSSVSNMSTMFQECRFLQEIPAYNTQSVTNFSSMFYECRTLKTIPALNTSAGTNFSAMFYNCMSLESIPLINTGNATNVTQMFYNCSALTTIPELNFAKVTSLSETFRLCSTLDTVPLLNTSNVTSFSNAFNSAYSLRSVPSFDTSKVTDFSSAFSDCYGLEVCPGFNTSNATTFSNMFVRCQSLTVGPSFTDTSKTTNFGAMFSQCTNLRSVPAYNTNAATTMVSMFDTCRALFTVPAFNTINVTSNLNILGTGPTNSNLGNLDIYNMKATLNVASCKLSKDRLEEVFNNCLRITATQTLSIGSNPGSVTFTKSCTTTNGSKDITVNNNTSLTTGMYVTGTNLGATRSVTFQDTGDTVTLTAHGLSDGKQVAFSAITSTTGISTYTVYYVVNATTDTFQLATTEGGTALALTTNGSGTMMMVYKVTNIASTTVTLDAPATATGSNQSLVFRNLNVSLATFKGWTVSG